MKKKFLLGIALSVVILGIIITVLLINEGKETEDEKDYEIGHYTEDYKFDFGIDDEFYTEGYNVVTVDSTDKQIDTYYYNEKRGYGFKKGVKIEGSLSRTMKCGNENIPEEVYKDYAIAGGSEFLCDIENGIYDVQVLVGSKSYSTTVVTCEDVKSNNIGIDGEISIVIIENVEVKDGQMNIKFDGSGINPGVINALIIIPQDKPENLIGEYNHDEESVKLKWDITEGADTYNIYRREMNGVTNLIGNSDNCEYIDEEVESGDYYIYYVAGQSSAGVETKYSDEFKVDCIDTTVEVPMAVENINIEDITSESIKIKWDKSNKADMYKIYWSDKKGDETLNGYKFILKTSENTALLSLNTATAGYIKIIAGNKGGYSEISMIKTPIGTGYTVQMEYLDRGLIATNTENGVFVGFRLSVDEYAENAEFKLLKNNNVIKSFSSSDSTNYLDKEGGIDDLYKVEKYVSGELVETSDVIKVNSENYFDIPLNVPSGGITQDGGSYTYTANDCSVGDVDGDGVYEIFVKWDPSNSKDNSQAGYTGNVYIDCYKMDGTQLYRIDLGKNIRAGAHYTQYMVYDFDGDGSCELIFKTSDGTVDGKGNVIGDGEADYRNSGGYILSGNEYLTLFDGQTGKAIDTIDYNPQRGSVSSWGDEYGNRVDRFLAGVAYLDGEHPSAVFARGYYTRAVIAAYDVVDKKLVERWVCDSNQEGNTILFGEGAHSLSTGDVDMDGLDEIVYGSVTIDNDGKILYGIAEANNDNSGGHGDALHLGDFNLKNPGLEIFMVHEEYPNDASIEMHDAATGLYLYNYPGNTDVGRGAAGDIDPRYEGSESWATGTDEYDSPIGYLTAADGSVISNKIPAANFLIYWDGDTGREILDHIFSSSAGVGVPVIYKWNYETSVQEVLFQLDGTYSNNYTKGNPCLQADIFGDWREELVVRSKDGDSLRIYSTTEETDFRLYTLMHDTQYRTSIAWQNTGYNQPPHTSFYIGYDRDLIEVPIKQYNIVK